MTFVGLLSITQFVLYVIMASVSKEHISNSTLIDFGAINTPRVVHRGQIYRIFVSSLLCKRVFEMLSVIGIQMLFGWQQEVLQRWGPFTMGAVLILSGVAQGLVSCIVQSDNNHVYAAAFNSFLALIGARMAWLYVSWDIKTHHIIAGGGEITSPNLGIESAELSRFVPPSCKDTGARELQSMEKSCELVMWLFMALMIIFFALVDHPKKAFIPAAAAVSGFLLGGAIFAYKLRKRYPVEYREHWFRMPISRISPELFSGLYLALVTVSATMLFVVVDVQQPDPIN